VARGRPVPPIAQHHNSERTTGLHIAYHCLTVFVQDCKDLVVAGVRSSIASQKGSCVSALVAYGNARDTDLKIWQNTPLPLAWGTSQHATENYARLVNVLHETSSGRRQLQHSASRMTYKELAKHMVQMVRASGGKITAPLRRHGSFPVAMRLALEYMDDFWKFEERREDFIISSFASMMRRMSIEFVPWHKDHEDRGSGRRSTSTCYDWWMILNRNSEKNTVAEPGTDQEMCVAIADAAALNDPFGPWTIPEYLHEMGILWDKKVRPTDWSLTSASLPKSGYVLETYHYVDRTFCGDKWWHHMALVWAILFSRVAPNVFKDRDVAIQAEGEEAVTRAIRRIPWVETTSATHKGCTQQQPYVTMVSTTIIAFLERQAPVWQEQKNGGFGSPWSDKHGDASSFLLFSLQIDFIIRYETN